MVNEVLQKIHDLSDSLYLRAKEKGVGIQEARVYRECASAVLALETVLPAYLSIPRSLTFQQLIEANLSRVEKWHSLKDWSTLEWAGAMCGEAGEAANFAKKLKRVETEIANNDKRMFGLDVPKEQLLEGYREGVLKEYADTVIYGILMCASTGATAEEIERLIRKVFNQKSMEYGFPERL